MMHPVIADNIGAIRALCREHGVVRLEVFGSVCTDGFDPALSDIDFLVQYPDDYDMGPLYRQFFGFQRSLASLLGCAVDLVEIDALDDPWFAREAGKTRRVVCDGSDVAQIA